MRPVSERDWDVMVFHLMAWYFVQLEPERSSQVVLIRLTDRCFTSLRRPYVLLHADPLSGHTVWLTAHLICLGMVSRLHFALWWVHETFNDQIKPYKLFFEYIYISISFVNRFLENKKKNKNWNTPGLHDRETWPRLTNTHPHHLVTTLF